MNLKTQFNFIEPLSSGAVRKPKGRDTLFHVRPVGAKRKSRHRGPVKFLSREMRSIFIWGEEYLRRVGRGNVCVRYAVARRVGRTGFHLIQNSKLSLRPSCHELVE